MRVALMLVVLAATLGIGAAQAQQTPDPPICNVNLREWGRLAGGSDAGAMRDLLARTPRACRELRGQIEQRISALTPAPQPRAHTEATTAPVDPCIGARTQWRRIETTGTIEQVQAYINDAPAACTAERTAAQTRLTALQEAARPQLPAQYAPSLQARLSPSAQAWIARENERARAYFRPYRLESRHSSELGGRGGSSNRSCTFTRLPQGFRRGAVVSSGGGTVSRNEPLVTEGRSQFTSDLCWDRDSATTTEDQFTSLQFLADSVVLTSSLGGRETTLTDIAGTFNLDPRGQGQLGYDLSWSTTTNWGATQSDRRQTSTCVESRRYRSGEWRTDFPFVIVAMSCTDHPAPQQTVTRTTFVIPELLTEVAFVGPVEQHLQSEYPSTTTITPSNLVLTTEGGAIRLSYDLDYHQIVGGQSPSETENISHIELSIVPAG